MFGNFDLEFRQNVVGAPFPLAGRAGGWVGSTSGFIAIS
jgi:hypothetical protein